jgi:hypothetical protein
LKNTVWEEKIDGLLRSLVSKLTENADPASSRGNGVVAMSDKVTQFAADVMSLFLFGQEFGCVENQRDEKNVIRNFRAGLPAFGFIGRFRFLREVVLKEWRLGKRLLPTGEEQEGMGWLVGEAGRRIGERESEMEKEGSYGHGEDERDFLQS